MHSFPRITLVVLGAIMIALLTPMASTAQSSTGTDCSNAAAQKCYINEANAYLATHPQAVTQKPAAGASEGLLALALHNKGWAIAIMLAAASLILLLAWKPAPDRAGTSFIKR